MDAQKSNATTLHQPQSLQTISGRLTIQRLLLTRSVDLVQGGKGVRAVVADLPLPVYDRFGMLTFKPMEQLSEGIADLFLTDENFCLAAAMLLESAIGVFRNADSQLFYIFQLKQHSPVEVCEHNRYKHSISITLVGGDPSKFSSAPGIQKNECFDWKSVLLPMLCNAGHLVTHFRVDVKESFSSFSWYPVNILDTLLKAALETRDSKNLVEKIELVIPPKSGIPYPSSTLAKETAFIRRTERSNKSDPEGVFGEEIPYKERRSYYPNQQRRQIAYCSDQWESFELSNKHGGEAKFLVGILLDNMSSRQINGFFMYRN